MGSFEGYAATADGLSAVDTAVDFRDDTPEGKDPDAASPTLRRYHQLLWSKPLPDGRPIRWDASQRSTYLHHRSEIGEFSLSSDSVMATYKGWVRMEPIVGEIPAAMMEDFERATYTIGAMMVWPSDRRAGVHTINGARGLNGQISDRMDLTMECVRRHYQGGASPLGKTLAAYGDFFHLFSDFDGFPEFFLLEDLRDPRTGDVMFFLPFSDFDGPSRPTDPDDYMTFREASMAFIARRNARIGRWVESSR